MQDELRQIKIHYDKRLSSLKLNLIYLALAEIIMISLFVLLQYTPEQDSTGLLAGFMIFMAVKDLASILYTIFSS